MVEPCSQCLVSAMCSEYCQGALDYYSLLIKKYKEEGLASPIFQEVSEYMMGRIRSLIYIINFDGYACFKKNIFSKETYKANSNGNIRLLYKHTKKDKKYFTHPF